MGCGSSSNVVPLGEGDMTNGHRSARNGQAKPNTVVKSLGGANGVKEDIPTVILPETPEHKPPLAFEIPIEDISSGPGVPPKRLLRLLQQQPPGISLPQIAVKLSEADRRRQEILQQRVVSASKRTQKILSKQNGVDREMDILEGSDVSKYGSTTTLKIPTDPVIYDERRHL